MLRLVDERDHEGAEVPHRLKEAWDYCGYLERLYSELWANEETAHRLRILDAPPPEDLHWAHALSAATRSLDLHGWRVVLGRDVWPRVDATLARLASTGERESPEGGLRLSDLAQNYRRSLRAALDLLDALLQRNRFYELQAVRERLGLEGSASTTSSSLLSHAALNFALGSPADVVLIGAHSSHYVRDAMSCLAESLQDPLQVSVASQLHSAVLDEGTRIAARYIQAQSKR
jgi:hypothetical protein